MLIKLFFFFIKKKKVQLFPIWKEKVDLDVEMETLLYRNQLVDFTDQNKFRNNLTRLVSGLNVIYENNSFEENDKENKLNSAKNLPNEFYPVGKKKKINFFFYINFFFFFFEHFFFF